MINKVFFVTLFILSVCFNTLSMANILIIANIDDQIITNHDLKKESDYLKILNPNLTQLSNNQILELAKNSLINEIIKKKEINKFININNKNIFLEKYLKDLYSKLNFNNEEQFQEFLKQKNTFTLDEIKEKIKVELFWNELIYTRYKNQLKIDRNAIIKKVNDFDKNAKKEFLLSEIIFTKKKDLSLDNLIDQIQLSIDEIGFNNTANVYSITESSKLGGKLGWVNESSLSEKILDKLNLIDEGKYTDIIKLGNKYLLLKIEKIRTSKVEIDKKKEVEKLIQVETNKQLNQFSKIYFDKSKINYLINEK
jgi:peptidyl-prolyl cis-trans isomerase SurA